MIKSNEVARLRVTGEDVFVLDITDAIATVRRPTSLPGGGLTHLVEQFTVAELETPEEFRTRTLAERVAMQQKIMQSGGSPSQEAIRELFQVQ